MRSRKVLPRFGAALVSIASIAALASCGGGGGGFVPTTAPPSTPVPSAVPLTDRARVRTDAEALLMTARIIGPESYDPGYAPLGPFAHSRRPAQRRAAQVSQCSVRPNTTNSPGSSTFSSTTDWTLGVTTQTYTDFYDGNCTQLERVAVITFPNPPGLAGGTFAGTTTAYDRGGSVLAYSTMQSSTTSTSITVQTTDARSVGGPAVSRSGTTCTIPQPGARTGTSCLAASVSTAGGITTGVWETVNVTTTPNGIGSRNSATMATNLYYGPSLALNGSSTVSWSITGGALIGSMFGTAVADLDGAERLTGIAFGVTDASGAISADSAALGGNVDFVLNRSTTMLAGVNVDVDGNGTITYADGSTEPAAGYTIFG